MRFRPEQHLRRQGDIRLVREEGNRLDCRSFVVWARRRGPEQPPAAGTRMTPVASIAAVGDAVQRNRAKRRLREVYRRHQAEVPAGFDLLVVARSAVNRRPFAELERNFAEACGRIA
ncbi:MAG TPA: ribonuclease P protein component [Opitutaceae bacterium]|jgi:ribonuclease P protein component|nr:ribonuclease P protein component [Opitutaceae bacterium]